MSSLVDWEPDYNYDTLKTNMKEMTFAERFGNLTVEQVLELNEKAKLTCGWEITTETKGDN